MTPRRTVAGPRAAAFGGLLALVALSGFQVSSRLNAQTMTTPSFTAAQSADGKTVYAADCASCHGANVDDGEFAPPLKGVEFRQRWGRQNAEALFTYMTTKMPPPSPGSLGEETGIKILAYLLQENGALTGPRELKADLAALKLTSLPAAALGASGGLVADVKMPPPPPKLNPLDKIQPVTDALLRNVPDGEWLSWRRTLDSVGFSPLRQITKANVGNLRVAWTWALPNGPNEATPLVHDGVMFVHSFGDKLQALDAATGDLLWQYSRRLPKESPASLKRSISLYGDRVYMPTSDVHLVALDVKNGNLIWDKPIADRKAGYTLQGGPIIAKGKVIVGTNGRAPGGNFIIALDANTGAEAWRFRVIPKPDEPGGKSWNGLPLEKRNGASVWVPGSYDPTLNLAFFGPAQTYDTGPLRNLIGEGEVTNDALYTDSTVAINPDTGKMAWFFQHQPNDQWDLDWAFERQIIKLPVNGVLKSVVVTGGKQNIYDILEADTGKYVFSMDLGLQNVVTAIDPKTGTKQINTKLIPGDGETKMVCPHAGGGRSWLPTSYNPFTKMLFIPIVEACMDLQPVAAGGRGSLSTGVRWTLRPPPNSDGKYGRVEAINLETRKVAWVRRQRAPQTTGVLATAGGVVFAGAMDRSFSAYDDATGAELFRTRLNDVGISAPISYLANGKQYVAMTVGNGGAQAVAFQLLVPDMPNPPDRTATLWVFEVPGK